MKLAGYVIGSLGLQAGMVAAVFYLLNVAIWAVLAAMLGGSLAMIGLGLIMWALYPIRELQADADEEPAEPVVEPQGQPAAA